MEGNPVSAIAWLRMRETGLENVTEVSDVQHQKEGPVSRFLKGFQRAN
jgi:hypothetical protein